MIITEKLYEDDDGYIGRYYDPVNDIWILSVEMNNWSYAIYKKCFRVLGKILVDYPGTYFSLVKGEKEKKFNELFGFLSTGLKTTVADRDYEVMYVRS